MMYCKVKPDCTECRDTGSDINPNVLRAYACDLRRHGKPLDSGLPGVLERAANEIERLRTVVETIEANAAGQTPAAHKETV